MKNLLGLFVFLLINLTLFSTLVNADELKLYSPTYFNQQNNELETISYLENEMLSFEMCSKAAKQVEAKYICGETTQEIDLISKAGSNVCLYNNINFSEIPCDDFKLELTFQEDNRERVINREFSREKESIALQKVLEEDIRELNSLELSYYLLLHTIVIGTNNQKANDIYDTLKLTRDNNLKCWPQGNCDPLTTAKILYNIKLAGYNKDSRLLDDGKVYLESLFLKDSEITYPSSSSSSDDYEINIEIEHDLEDEINCDLIIDGGSADTYSFDENSNLEDLYISENINEDINFECEETIDEIHYVLANKIIYNSEEENKKNYDYTISNSNLDQYDTFELKLQFEHDFGADEIECDIIIDGTTTTYTFDNQSSRDDLTIEEAIDEEFEVDCEENIDYSKILIFGGDIIKNSFSNEDSFYFALEELIDKKYNFEIVLDYDFRKDVLTCDLTIDGGSSKEIEFEEGDETVIDRYKAGSSVALSCDDTIDNIESFVIDKFNRKQLKKETLQNSKHSFSIPSTFSQYQCLGEDNTCNEQTTFYSLMSYTDIENYNQLENYISSLFEVDQDFPLLQTTNPYEDAGKYLLIENNNDLIESLKFLQNNDGSWGTGDTQNLLYPTIWSKLGISQREKSTEHIEDSLSWIYQQEPEQGWGTIEKNSLSYLAIKEQVKPYITSNSISTINGPTSISIMNPTIFELENLKISFTGDLKNNLIYKENLGTLSQNQKLNITLTPSAEVQEKISGTMIISGLSNNKNIELLNIPLTIEQDFPFRISKTSLGFTTDDKKVIVPISHNSKSQFFYTCKIATPLLDDTKEIIIEETTKSFTIENEKEITGNVEITLECESNDEAKTLLETLTLTKIQKTFNTTQEEIIIDSTNDKAVSLTNLFNTQQIITFRIEGEIRDYLTLPESSKMFAINETREFYISVNETLFNELNTSVNGNLIITGNQYIKTIPLTLTTQSQGSFPWGSIILWSSIILILGFGALVLIRYRQLQQEEENDSQEDNNTQEFDDEIVFE